MFPDSSDEVVQLYLDDIIPNRFQPREIFDERALKELAVSIKEHGVIQPIIVRNVNGKYEIIAGERRYKASALAGLTKIPAIVRNLDDKESSKVALLENLQRKNLNPIEEARTYQKILEIDEMTQEALAKTMGKSQSAVANKIRLLTLPEEVQEALLKEQISERHARSLLNIPDAASQKEMLKKIINNKMSVRSVEEEIKEKYPKENENKSSDSTESIPEIKIASESSFVNDSPLTPTAEIPKDESNYGKVTIAPPEGEDMPQASFFNFNNEAEEDNDETTAGKFLNLNIEKEEDEGDESTNKFLNINNTKTNDSQNTNFLNINNEDESDEDKEDDNSIFNMPAIISDSTDNSKKENKNINDKIKPLKNADLDNLLSMGNPTTSTPSNSYLTPAEKIVKQDPNIDLKKDIQSDYFNASDISSVHIAADDLFKSQESKEEVEEEKETNNFIQPIINMNEEQDENDDIINENKSDESSEILTLEDATDKIRYLVGELQAKGLNVNIDEMNFDKTYQIIIKIKKEQE